MKVLLDECLPLDFRHSFVEHDTHTAQWAGLKGLSNGDLLRAAELNGYDVLLTVDQALPHQQTGIDHKIAVILIRSTTSKLEDLLPLVPGILNALRIIAPGHVEVV